MGILDTISEVKAFARIGLLDLLDLLDLLVFSSLALLFLLYLYLPVFSGAIITFPLRSKGY